MKVPKVLVTVPASLRQHILTKEAEAKLRGMAQVTMNEDDHNWSGEELAAKLPGQDAILASWGLPELTAAVLVGADRLKLVAYGAGSIKGWATDALYDKGVAVSHSAARIAESVAEYSLMMAMVGLRKVSVLDQKMKAGAAWPKSRGMRMFEINGAIVGLLGMGYVGSRTAKLFQALGAEVWAYDPYLSEDRAAELGVRKADLDELLSRCQVVSVHLPVTDETHHMLGARELALLQDGAVFVNSARAWTVEQDAMLAELASGRIWAALDVYDPEPLAVDSPLRKLENVMLTPHVAGQTVNAYHGLMDGMIAEIERFWAGEPLLYQVTREMLATMA